MEATELFEELADQFSQFLQLKNECRSALENAQRLSEREPKRPTVFTCAADLLAYQRDLAGWMAQVDAIRRRGDAAVSRLEDVETGILHLLPLEDVWFRVVVDGRAYAVAVHTYHTNTTYAQRVRYEKWPEDGVLQPVEVAD